MLQNLLLTSILRQLIKRYRANKRDFQMALINKKKSIDQNHNQQRAFIFIASLSI